MIGEIAARLSGGYMSGWTYPYASDLNLTKQAIFIAWNEIPQKVIEKRIPVSYAPSQLCKNEKCPYDLYEVPCVRTSAERAWYSIPGQVEYIENINEYSDKAVFDVLPRSTVSLGSKVNFPRNNVEKCGNIIAVSNDDKIAIDAAQDAVSNIFITLKPDTKETEDFLSGISQQDEKGFPPSAFEQIPPDILDSVDQIIGENQKVSDFIPKVLQNPEYENIKDWNFNTIKQTAQKFDILRKNHPEFDLKTFWKAVLKGGLQAAVYFSDTVKLKQQSKKK